MLCSFLIILLLIKFSGLRKLPNILFSIVVFALAWYAGMYLLVTSGQIVHFPYLYYKGIPLYYLIAPFSYLYVRFSLYPDKKLRWIDGLHVLPAALSVIDMLPYALASPKEQQTLLQAIANDINMTYQHRLAFLPPVVHYIVRLTQGLIYITLQSYMLYHFTQWKYRDIAVKRWLVSLTVIIGLLNLLQAVVSVSTLTTSSYLFISSMPIIAMSAVFLVLSICLFFWPEVLYGVVGAREVTKKASISPSKEQTTDLNTLADQLSNYLEASQIFRKEGLSIHELSISSGIPQHQLSMLLNSHHQQHFNSYINTWRIRYVMARLEQGDARQYKLETLANDAGFSSRNTFYTAFKKVTGETPTSYLARLDKEDG